MTSTENLLVMHARKTHVHSRLAVERLSSLCIGTIKGNTAPALEKRTSSMLSLKLLGSDKSAMDILFNPMEFKRYSLVTIEPLTDHVKEKTFKLCYCLMYPNDYQKNEPFSFLPGQTMEVEAFINKKIHRAHYFPIHGNMVRFEIVIKVEKGDALAQYLTEQEPGVNQYKIRGPFGDAIVSPEKPFMEDIWIPDCLLFLVAGKGFIQVLNILDGLLYPRGEQYQVIHSCNSSRLDQERLRSLS
jgi:hypothetical protein